MITAGDFRKGVTIEWEGGVWTIVDFQHVKPGKGAAFVRTKLKNVMTGAVVERSFNPTDKQPRATIETKEMQYVYNDGEFYYFMDCQSNPRLTARLLLFSYILINKYAQYKRFLWKHNFKNQRSSRDVTPERRCSSRTFRYGYLVTT